MILGTHLLRAQSLRAQPPLERIVVALSRQAIDSLVKEPRAITDHASLASKSRISYFREL